MKPIPSNVLLVEDNEGDILLAKEAVEELKLSINLNIVKDGEKALAYLRREAEFTTATHPDLVLLDINIPKISGLDVLKKLKSDPLLKSIPIIMLTTSSSEKDVELAYKNHANCYIVKPDDAVGLINTVQTIQDFWFGLTKLPKE